MFTDIVLSSVESVKSSMPRVGALHAAVLDDLSLSTDSVKDPVKSGSHGNPFRHPARESPVSILLPIILTLTKSKSSGASLQYL